LTALKLDLCWILKNIQDRENTVEKLKKMVEMTNTIIKKVQRISAEIHPSMLEDLGLASTIEWYCGEFEERTGLKCNLTLEDLTSGNPQSTLALFRILQEALTNVIRHSEASNVNIELRNSENQIILTIEDDGIGISPEKIKSYSSLGLVGMFERARQCGGKVEFAPKESQGTKLIITIDGPENNYS
jgi:signal transduction histidine kinase